MFFFSGPDSEQGRQGRGVKNLPDSIGRNKREAFRTVISTKPEGRSYGLVEHRTPDASHLLRIRAAHETFGRTPLIWRKNYGKHISLRNPRTQTPNCKNQSAPGEMELPDALWRNVSLFCQAGA